MRPFTAIVHNDLRRRVRDRSLVVQAVVGPLLLAVVVSLALGDSSDFRPRLAVAVDGDAGLGAEIAAGLEEVEGLDVRRYGSLDEVRDAVADDEVGAGIALPSVPDDAGDPSAPPATIAVVVDGGDSVHGAVAESIAASIADELAARRVAVGTATALGVPPDVAGRFVDELRQPVALRETSAEHIDPASYFAPSMALLFLFFAVGAAARSFIGEEKDGTLARLRAAPIRPGTVLGAKELAVVVIGVASVVVVWLASAALIGADWGPPAAVLAVIVATVLAVAGIGSVIAGLARTEAQANGYTLVVAFLLALLGGNFVDPSVQPESLGRVARLTPNGQALQAFTDLAAGAGAAVASTAVAVNLVVAALTGAIGWQLLSRRAGT